MLAQINESVYFRGMTREPFTRESLAKWATVSTRPPLIMGILNVTPDSFSDGGDHADPSRATDYAMALLDDGAAIIDVGAESTRPGAVPVNPDEQIRRSVGVIENILRKRAHTLISIDTTHADVARTALAAGAAIVNDISAGQEDPRMFDVVRESGAFMVLMHMQGTPQTMQLNPQYVDVVAEVEAFLRERIEVAIHSNIPPTRLIIDPGIGFGKTVEHNLQLIAATTRLAGLGVPLLIGASRKGFIGRITSEADPRDRVIGSCVTAAYAISNGASIVRVHDVKQTRQALEMMTAITLSSQE